MRKQKVLEYHRLVDLDIKFANKMFLEKKKHHEKKLAKCLLSYFKYYENERIMYYKNFDYRSRVVDHVLSQNYLDKEEGKSKSYFLELLKSKCDSPIYFPTGDYKGHIVQNVFKNLDYKYCIDYARDVMPNSENEFLIVNYIQKEGARKTNKLDLEIIIKEIIENIFPKEYHKEFMKLLGKIDCSMLYDPDFYACGTWYIKLERI